LGATIPASSVVNAIASPAASDFAPDRRIMQARLQIVIDSLQATILFNPLLTAICLPAFAIQGSPFGQVSSSRLALAEMLQLLSAAIAYLVFRRFRRVAADETGRVHAFLIAGQALFSSVWGVSVFLFWLPGNPVNQVFILMVMAVVSYSVVFARSMLMSLLVTAFIVQGGLILSKLFIAGGQIAHIMAPVIVIYTLYLWLMGRASNRRIGTMIGARIANEDLATALRQARDDAMRKRYEAEAANASKTAFLANMSHELRTPLNAILGFSDIIAHQSMGPGEAVRYAAYAADIHASGAHLLSLINDMLDVAKIESGRMEIEPRWIDPLEAVESVRRLVAARAAQKHQSLATDFSPATPLVFADERAFRQMLLNLLSNALKFTPQGGQIRIACAGRPEGGLDVVVRDDGPGIPEDKLARVLEPFSQVDNRFDREAGGTGLGLALVDGLIRLHGGAISLSNNRSGGLTAALYFPSTMAANQIKTRA
jgi:two-component system cell cycle sensor histidine kinase PleC